MLFKSPRWFSLRSYTARSRARPGTCPKSTILSRWCPGPWRRSKAMPRLWASTILPMTVRQASLRRRNRSSSSWTCPMRDQCSKCWNQCSGEAEVPMGTRWVGRNSNRFRSGCEKQILAEIIHSNWLEKVMWLAASNQSALFKQSHTNICKDFAFRFTHKHKFILQYFRYF